LSMFGMKWNDGYAICQIYQNKIYQLCTVYCRIMHFSPNHQTNNI
jgi:hypothetical protein